MMVVGQHRLDPVDCQDCGKTLKGKYNLIQHQTNFHGLKGKFECETCGKNFARKDEYDKHTRTHTGEKPFKCQSCDKAFATQSLRSRHEKGLHRISEYSCDICNKVFNNGWIIIII